MPVYKIGDEVKFALNLKVLKVFGYKDNIYYIVEINQDKVPWKKANRMFGILDYNGQANIPEVVRQKADSIIRELKNNNNPE